MTDTVALFCVLKADAVSGLAPDFLLRVPAQSILLCASLKTNLYLCGLQEILTTANLCVHPSQSHWKWAASQDKHSDGFFFLRLSSSSQNGKTLPCSKEQQKQAEPLMFPLWSFSSSGTQRHGLIFLEISFFFPLNACGLSDTVLQWLNPGHFITLPHHFYLHYTFPASLCCGRQKCWSWHAGRPHRRQLHSEF